MSSETVRDPMELMRGAFVQAIERWSEAMEEVVSGDSFAATADKIFATSEQGEAVRAQAVERWSQAMEEIVGSEAFAAASGQFLALYAQQQQSFRAASRMVAESIHMPTTEDLAEVARLVINVERKVEELTDESTDVVKRLTAIEARLAGATDAVDAIPARLTAIEEQLAGVAASSQALLQRLTPIEEAVRELAQRPADRDAEPAGSGPSAGTSGVRRAASASAAAKKPAAKSPTVKKPAAAKATPARRRKPPADG